MAHASNSPKGSSTISQIVVEYCRVLASLKLAVALLIGLSIVLAWATFLEARKGIEYAQWSVYGSRWFIALLALLGLNILAATIIRFPWKRGQIGFLLAHAGVLVLLVGSLQTYLGAVEGRISLQEGETADSILLPHRSQLTLVGHGESGQLSTEFAFSPGPVDWEADKPLDFGQVGGVGLKVLAFYHHARPRVDFVPDDSQFGQPAMKLAVTGSAVGPPREVWCEANPFGGRLSEGRAVFLFQQAPVASMLDDFQKPPTDDLGKQGVLSVHYQGKRYQVPIDGNVGKKVAVGDTGLSIEILGYFPNSVSAGGGQFRSAGTAPKNPMLQLKIHLPDEKKPLAEIAYAKNPFVNYSLMRGNTCPVRLWYHHPTVPARPGAEFLQTPDGKLYCRVGAEGKYEFRGEVKVGDRIKISADLQARILAYYPHARREVTYEPVKVAQGEPSTFEAAALVELSVGGQSHQVWIARSDQPDAFKTIPTSRGPLMLRFGYERIPLGFSLKLLDFVRGLNPGRMGDQSYTSEVQLVDHARGVDERRRISMNQPLAHGKYTFYQSSFSELPGGGQISVFSVAYDPGRLLKYLGSLMICLGIFVIYYLNTFFRRKASRSGSEGQAGDADTADKQQSVPATRSVPCAT